MSRLHRIPFLRRLRSLRPTRFETQSVLLFAAWALGGSSSLAQSPPATRTPTASEAALVSAFDRADRDRDGRLDRDEVQRLPAVAEQFQQLDRNGDQHLSREEFMNGLKT